MVAERVGRDTKKTRINAAMQTQGVVSWEAETRFGSAHVLRHDAIPTCCNRRGFIRASNGD